MSAFGQLVYFSGSRPADFPKFFERLLQILQMQAFQTVSNFKDESTDGLKVVLGEREPSIASRERWTTIEQFHPEEALRYLRRGRMLGFSTYISPVIASLNSAVRGLPSGIVDNWIVDGAMVRLGSHELFESMEEVKHFGHAEFSVSFGGPGAPVNWATCRRMVLALPEVKAFAKRLEPILGEVKTCVYWDG